MKMYSSSDSPDDIISPKSEPLRLSPDQIELSQRLDEFYKNNSIKKPLVRPSDIYRGALSLACNPQCDNPDWISQSANSLRELLYPIWLTAKARRDKPAAIKGMFTDYGSIHIESVFDEIKKLYGILNDLTHHGVDLRTFSADEFKSCDVSVFRDIIKRFEYFMHKALTLSLHALAQINALLQIRPEIHRDQVELKNELNLNFTKYSLKDYFFATADECWLDWLWQNNFLDAIKHPPDASQSRLRMPELSYLASMAEIVPEKVVDIILSVPISPETCNPEVLTRFLEICSGLPAELIARMAPKLLKENWVPLTNEFNRYGFEYERMFKTLDNAGDFKTIIILAQAVLTIRPVDVTEATQSPSWTPFYFESLSYSKVFENIIGVSDEYAEQALDMLVKVMSAIVRVGGAPDHPSIFPIKDTFALLDVDFFTLDFNQSEQWYERDNVRNLVAVVLILVRRLMSEQCDDQLVRRIWTQHLSDLPKNGAMWRLQLSVLSLRPILFKDELKQAFFRLFSVSDSAELLYGAEYKKALRKGFQYLDDEIKYDYVLKIIAYFNRSTQNADDRKWNIRHGSQIFSSILDYLDKHPELKKQVEDAGFSLDAGFEPKPPFGPIKCGTVHNKSPVTQEELANHKISDIVNKLKDCWAPANLRKENTSDDIFNPINAEGVSGELKRDIPLRLQEYVDHAVLFFEPDKLDLHYTYAYFQGVLDAIKNCKESLKTINLDCLFDLCFSIRDKSKNNHAMPNVRERDAYHAWLAGSNAVHLSIADVLMELFKAKDGVVYFDFSKYRDRIFVVLTYLMEHPDPIPADEEPETAKSKIQDSAGSEYMVSDPFTIAINSVRGRAFEAFVLFVFLDGRRLIGENKKMSDDVKELYARVLRQEKTRAMMFVFGHYLPFFYFRDKLWIKGLLPVIFPVEPDKKALFTAALEGYLVNKLYSDMFLDSDIQRLYERALELTAKDYPAQKHFKAPDESLAEHFMLAYMYHDSFGLNNPLLQAFWKENEPELHAKFISAIGRVFIASNNAATAKFMQENPVAKKRLKLLWYWMLETYSVNHADAAYAKAFKEFGWWITCEKDLFEPGWLATNVRRTLEITNGELTWNLGLKNSLTRIADAAPVDTVEIIRLYMLEGGVKGSNYHGLPPRVDDEWIEALQILYARHETKDGTYKLIDDLIRDGGRAFWGLKKIVDQKSTRSENHKNISGANNTEDLQEN